MDESADRAALPPDPLTMLWRRIRDHRIAQWTVGYVAVAYGIQHAVTLTSEAYEWPNIVARLSMTLLAMGLPIAMTLAWYHGEKASRRVSGPELTIISLLLLTSSLLFAVLVHPAGITTPRAQEASIAAARAASASIKGAVSVAVLPFLNLSADKDQEFFSDGMTEEITAALAKVPDLRVVARTSAFEFKGKNIEIEKIGQQLHATHLIEGSVRKAGNHLRITAQLIKADDGTHIWAEDYDRELTDVFAIQEDIARAITASLHMTLGLKPGENLVNQRTRDASVHDEYLRAKRQINADVTEAIRLLNDVVARDPNYAPAWGMLARAYANQSLNGLSAVRRGALEEAAPAIRDIGGKAAAAAASAYRLDPNNSDAVYGYSELEMLQGRPNSLERMKLVERALSLDPDNPEALDTYSLMLAALGLTKQAIRANQYLLSIEPFVPVYHTSAARFLIDDGRPADAIKILQGFATAAAILHIAEAYAAEGKFAEAADTAAQIKVPDVKFQQVLQNTVRLLRGAPALAPENDRPELGASGDWIYVFRGAPERTAQAYVMYPRAGVTLSFLYGLEFAPHNAAMRKTKEFKQYVRESGALEYWRARGWPPQCHPTTGNDFECS